MKETVNVNIASQAFMLDVDAYGVLRSYLDDVRSRIPESDTETIGDIECRMAEIFRDKLSSPMMVVSLAIVRDAIAQMGCPSDFGERCRGEECGCGGEPRHRQLYRSRNNCSVAGICGGLAEFFNVDASLLRLITFLLILFGGLSLWIYIILWIVIPKRPLNC